MFFGFCLLGKRIQSFLQHKCYYNMRVQTPVPSPHKSSYTQQHDTMVTEMSQKGLPAIQRRSSRCCGRRATCTGPLPAPESPTPAACPNAQYQPVDSQSAVSRWSVISHSTASQQSVNSRVTRSEVGQEHKCHRLPQSTLPTTPLFMAGRQHCCAGRAWCSTSLVPRCTTVHIIVD